MNLLYGTESVKETLNNHRILHSFFNRFAEEWNTKRMLIDTTKITLYHRIVDHLICEQPPTHWYWLLKVFLYCYENRLAEAAIAADEAYRMEPLHPSVLWVRSVLLLAKSGQSSYVSYVKRTYPYDDWSNVLSQRV